MKEFFWRCLAGCGGSLLGFVLIGFWAIESKFGPVGIWVTRIVVPLGIVILVWFGILAKIEKGRRVAALASCFLTILLLIIGGTIFRSYFPVDGVSLWYPAMIVVVTGLLGAVLSIASSRIIISYYFKDKRIFEVSADDQLLALNAAPYSPIPQDSKLVFGGWYFCSTATRIDMLEEIRDKWQESHPKLFFWIRPFYMHVTRVNNLSEKIITSWQMEFGYSLWCKKTST